MKSRHKLIRSRSQSKMNDCKGQMVFQQGYRTGQKTSKIADEKANKKFKARHCQLVYTAVRCHCNGGTAKEIAKAGRAHGIDLTDEQYHKRLHDLRDRKFPLLRNGEDRECEISKSEVYTWWVT